MNVAHLLTSQATQRPDAAAIIEGSGRRARRISFAALDDRSSRCATLLHDAGVRPGEHVLVFVPMSIDLYVALIAIFRLGAVATFLDPSAGRDHIDRCCEMTQPAAMIAVSKAHLLRLSSAALRRVGHKFTVGWPMPGAARFERGEHCSPMTDIAPRALDDPALLTFTSGSTGLPKAAVRSHGFLAAQHASLQRAISLIAGQVDLPTLPIFSLANLASGVTSVIPDTNLRKPASIDAAPVLRQIVEHRVTRCVASPAFLERLLDAEDAPRFLRSIERIDTGGAPVFPPLLQRLQQAMPLAHVAAVYGSTEAEPIAHVGWHDVSADDSNAMFAGRGLLAGTPVTDIQLRIIRNQFGQPLARASQSEFDLACLPCGEIGEIIVQGDHVLRGYLGGHGDEQTKWRVDNNTWHRTGDAGYLDERGRLWLLGRAQAKIEDERGTLYPFAVECAASRIVGVARSAMIQHAGKRLLLVQRAQSAPAPDIPAPGAPAHITPAPIAPSELETILREALTWAKIDQIQFLPRIPLDKRHNAKIDYPALRQLLKTSGV